jgi:hypothetical protein
MGESGTEVQTHSGEDLLSTGALAYRIDTQLSAGSEAWNGSMYYSCDASGPGLFLMEWNVNMSVDIGMGVPMDMSVVGELSSPRKDLPAVSEFGSAGSWSYNYTLSISNDMLPLTVPTSGTFQEMGTTSVTVPAGTFDVYCVSNTFTQDRSALEIIGKGGTINGYGTLCYAEGIGLVKEETIDTATSEILMVKELSSYSGL